MDKSIDKKLQQLPYDGIPREELLRLIEDLKADDVDWKHGRIWGLVYHASEKHSELLAEAYRIFCEENPLSLTAFPSLRRLEGEVVSMLISLLGGDDETRGTMTSGGTESILLAVKAYRDFYKVCRPSIDIPEMVLPCTAHPAFLKAAHYFGIKPVIVPVGADYRADVKAIGGSCNDRTIMIVASAPSFSHGVVDPIVELGDLSLALGIGMHVDACLGGFVLPFLRRLGYQVPPFDFEVPGVTSISIDLHKYGYAVKGTSAVLYRNSEIRRHQFFACTQWTGGLYFSPTMLGTRPGGAIAAAWAALMSLGEKGYMEFARRTFEGTEKLIAGIKALPGLEIVGQPDMTVFAFTSHTGNIFSIGSRMERRGWRLHRQTNPESIHLVVTLNHLPVIDQFLGDLRLSVYEELENPLRADDLQQRQFILYGHQALHHQTKDATNSLMRWFEEHYDI